MWSERAEINGKEAWKTDRRKEKMETKGMKKEARK